MRETGKNLKCTASQPANCQRSFPAADKRVGRVSRLNSRLNPRHLDADQMPLPHDAVGPLTSLVVSLINLQSPPSRDYPKRYYSALFRELPPRELYPDYFVLIKEPRSLNGIMVSASS